ncbi:hypothetical protein D9M70_523400 [compost metagenome]
MDSAGLDVDREWLLSAYDKAADGLMRDEWRLALGEADETDAGALIARLIVMKAGRREKLSGAALIALGELCGLNPIVFLRYAVRDLGRRGVTYVTGEEARVVSEVLRGPDVGEAENLARRLSRGMGADGVEEFARFVTWQARSWEVIAPEWGVGRDTHIAQWKVLGEE